MNLLDSFKPDAAFNQRKARKERVVKEVLKRQSVPLLLQGNWKHIITQEGVFFDVEAKVESVLVESGRFKLIETLNNSRPVSIVVDSVIAKAQLNYITTSNVVISIVLTDKRGNLKVVIMCEGDNHIATGEVCTETGEILIQTGSESIAKLLSDEESAD